MPDQRFRISSTQSGTVRVAGPILMSSNWLSTADGQIVSRVRAVDSKVSAPLVTNGSSVFVYGEDGELASVSAP